MAEENEDRISKLPDSVLSEILSLIDLKLAIRTSILSNRWKPLWTSLPNFNFDFALYKFETRSPFYVPDEKILAPYIHFVNRVLTLRDNSSRIGRFRLAFDVNVDPRFIQNCVDYAVNHNVQDFHIAAFHSPKPFEFPRNFFTCRSLQKLSLKYYTKSMVIPKPFHLPTLKTLYLERFPFRDDDPFSFPLEPFSSFPDLEELTLDCCVVDGLIVSAPELRILELLFRGYHPQFSSESKIGKISTPKLTSFKFEGQVSLVCSMENIPCLEKIYVDLYPLLESPYTDAVEQKMPLNLIKLLEQLKNAKFVTISANTIEVLAKDSTALKQHLSPFTNLKHLRLIKAPGWYFPKLSPANIVSYLTNSSAHSDSVSVEILERN